MTGRVLVTGITSFTGPYLARALRQRGYDVYGLGQDSDGAMPDVTELFDANLLDLDQVRQAVAACRPDYVIHLAAITYVPHGDAGEIYQTNVVGTRNLLQSLSELPSAPARVLLASSANVYGNATEGQLDEATPFAPANDYAASKVAMEYMAGIWLDRLPLAFTRPFNYTGRGQSSRFLIPKIVSHFRDRKPVIELGNTDVIRDFSDVRFIAEAYAELIERAETGEAYNLCSSARHTLTSLIERMNSVAGYEIEVRVNPDFVRANEVYCLVGDNDKLLQLCPGLQVIPFEETLQWIYSSPPDSA